MTLPSTAQGTVSRTDATVYATSAAILGAVAGQAADGHALSGTNTAINSAVNNRLLHPDEQKTLAQMKKGQSPQEQYRLAAAACADIHCAAGLPANTPHLATLEALQAAGRNFPTERALLTKNGLFGYTLLNEVSDWVSRDQVVVRGLGAFQATGGLVGYTTGVGIMATGWETGVGVVAGGALAATSADYFQAGYRTMVSGTDTPTLGQQVLTDLGLSPTTAAWTYAAMSLGAGVGAASALSAADGAGAGAAEATAAANTESANQATYADYLQKAQTTLDVSTAPNQAVFYSGSGNRALAEAFATANGKTTLEMTPGGSWLDSQKLFEDGSNLSFDQARTIWSVLSQRYAESASGTAVGFVEGAVPEGIFNTVEYPALQANPNITNVITGGH